MIYVIAYIQITHVNKRDPNPSVISTIDRQSYWPTRSLIEYDKDTSYFLWASF